MNKRPFDEKAYNAVDKPANIKLTEIFLNNSNYVPLIDTGVELYKTGDAVFTNGKNFVVFENETREDFKIIVNEYQTVHIPIRKQYTPAHFYIVWKNDFSQFILINKKTLNKYRNNIVRGVKCKYRKSNKVSYVEDFIDIPKNETQWYIIGPNFLLQKADYD